jgi:hypothetical protein
VLGTADFCISFRVKRTGAWAGNSLFEPAPIGADGGRSASFALYVDSDQKLKVFAGALPRLASVDSVPTGQWVEICLQRASGVWQFFINGVLQANTLAYGINLTHTAHTFGTDVGTPSNGSAYLLDELNVLKGSVRYGGSYVLPLQAFGNSYSPGLPASAVAGEAATDGVFLYVCTASGTPGTWKKVALI